MQESQPVLLIDFSALFRRAWHVSSEVSVAFESTVSGVNRATSRVPGALVAICCDGKGNWRKSIDPEYKAHREKQPESMYGEMDRTLERLSKDGHLIWKVDGFEADDLIATACTIATGKGHNVTIVSSDKDLMQLLESPRVDYLACHTWEIVGSTKVLERYGVEPRQLRDWLALVGDKSDNVKGCPGIGETKATKLLQTYGDLDGIWQAIDVPETFKGSQSELEKLRANVLNVETAKKLVSLRTDAPINFDDIYGERKEQSLCEPEMIAENATEPEEESLSKSDISETEQSESSIGTESVVNSALVPVEYHRALEPKSFQHVTICAKVLFSSRLYQKFRSWEAIAAVIMRGREFGLGAGTALDVFHVVEGRPYPYAYLLIALAERDPNCEYIFEVESDENHATWETKHKNNPIVQRITYTIEQARTAGLIKPKSGWEKHPEDMLTKTAGSKLARRVYRSATLGLYSIEEMGFE